jgi:hypothetical protein
VSYFSPLPQGHRSFRPTFMTAPDERDATGVTTAVAADRVAEERIATVRKLGSKHWGRLLAR